MIDLPRDFERYAGQLFDTESETKDFLRCLREGETHRGMRANLLKATPEYLQSIYGEALTPNPFCDFGFVLNDDRKVNTDILHFAGAFYMQEPSAQCVVSACPPRNGSRVLDACAAPGGKTGQIASLNPEGLIIANEYDKSRSQVLAENVERMGIRNAMITCGDTALLAGSFEGFFDYVYVDCPCSGEGMFRKEEAAISNWSVDNVAMCAARGGRILDNCAATVASEGRLIFSTCTFNILENEGVIDDFLTRHDDFELIDVSAEIRGVASSGINFEGAKHDMSLCARVFPHRGIGEGHFVAVMQRRGECECRVRYMPVSSHTSKEIVGEYDLWTDEAPYGWFSVGNSGVDIFPFDTPVKDRLWVVRCGVPFLIFNGKNNTKVHFSFVRALKRGYIRHALDLPLSSPLLKEYIRGEELDADVDFSGFGVICADGLAVGPIKVSGGRAKNHLPKGLRIR